MVARQEGGVAPTASTQKIPANEGYHRKKRQTFVGFASQERKKLNPRELYLEGALHKGEEVYERVTGRGLLACWPLQRAAEGPSKKRRKITSGSSKKTQDRGRGRPISVGWNKRTYEYSTNEKKREIKTTNRPPKFYRPKDGGCGGWWRNKPLRLKGAAASPTSKNDMSKRSRNTAFAAMAIGEKNTRGKPKMPATPIGPNVAKKRRKRRLAIAVGSKPHRCGSR